MQLGTFSLPNSKPIANSLNAEQRHALACLQRCQKFVEELHAGLERRASQLIAGGPAVAAKFFALDSDVRKARWKLNSGISLLKERGQLRADCAALIAAMTDRKASRLPGPLRAANEMAKKLGIMINMDAHQPPRAASTARQDKFSDAIGETIEDSEEYRRVLQKTTAAISGDANVSVRSIKIAKQAAAEIRATDVEALALQEKCDAIAGVASPDEPAGQRQPGVPAATRTTHARPPVAKPMTVREIAAREWIELTDQERKRFTSLRDYAQFRAKQPSGDERWKARTP